MNKKSTRLLVAAGLIAAMGMISLIHARDGLAFGRSLSFYPPNIPLHMRLTGVLHPYEAESDIGGLHTFPVTMHKKQWIFQTEKTQTLTGSQHGSSVLARLFPTRLRFVGRDELIGPLMDPDIEGRTVVLTGYLYFSSNRFWVTELDEPDEEKGGPQDP